VPSAPEIAVSADEAFARTAELRIRAEALGLPVGSLSVDWPSVIEDRVIPSEGSAGENQAEGDSQGCAGSSAESAWTMYTETCAAGPKCPLPGTQFLKADGSPVLVDALHPGDELQGPAGLATVEANIPHANNNRSIVLLRIRLESNTLEIRVTHDHRLALQHGAYRKACDCRRGDVICTSEGEFPVSDVNLYHELTPVFEVTIVSDHSVYMTMGVCVGMVAAFGAAQKVPYDHAELVEFRFKGPICNTMGLAETWLREAGHGRFNNFGLKFWATRGFAVWAPRDRADAFWIAVSELLHTEPKGSKLQRQPVPLLPGFVNDASFVATPPPLTP